MPDGLSVTPATGAARDHIYYAGVYSESSFIRKDLQSGEMEVINLPLRNEYPEASMQISAPHFIYENELYVQFYALGLPGGAQVERFIMNLDSGEIRPHELTIDYPIVGMQPPLVSEYEPGIVYINTTTGLLRVDNLNSSYTVMFEDQMSLLREGSMLMVEDEEGYIWLNNLTGLTRLDPLTESVEYFEVARDRYTANRANPTALPNGEIIFPGNASYIRYNPGDLSSNNPAGETLIISLQAERQLFELLYSNQEPEIQSDQNTLTFNFTGLDHKNPASLNYRYRILGAVNEQWTQVGTQRSVFIPNLRAGEYTFEVQSGSKFGSFDGQTARLNFSILPPWWNTYPAYIAYILIFGGLVFGIDRFQRSRLIQRERERAREKELEQAKEIEQAYENLKSAQDQLVQQEKLASLGQLTAGIAHEIKNPLNFVNNFSELSIELIEEARDEIKELNSKFNITNSDLSELLDDIETNLKTINKHGTRADSIVKSMLQHSRGSDGQMEPTALNALLKEYVNLAFHGMRAGKNPINMDMKLELDEEVGEVPVIAEDISRVVVNLCNNAFDAMRDKVEAGQTGEEKYIPKLTLRTTTENDKVIIDVADNGPGIPDDFKDRILQPFFTTKKGTQGTGLGLSITNDIIKAHGGELHIESDKSGTLFRISLPKNQGRRQ
jgi:signal transduction histidine kinase